MKYKSLILKRHLPIYIMIFSGILFSCNKEDEITIIEQSNKNKEQEEIINKNIILEEKSIKNLPKIDIFHIKLFENIGDTIEYYNNREGFSIIDNTVAEEHREKEDPDTEMIASNDEIIIHYQTYRNKLYRTIEIFKNTDQNVFGQYIGLSKEKIIEIFGEEKTPWPGNLLHMDYINDNFDTYISFYYRDNIIYKIVYGDFL
jgi:hypothetical protein